MNPTVILIADDDPSVAEVLRTDMEAEGWQVFSTVNGDATIRFLHEYHPDLVILDIGMPGINGVDVCRHIAAICTTPVIMLTGRRDAETRARCLGMGAAAYITKPFRPKTVIDTVKAAFLRRRAGDLRTQHPLSCGNITVDFATEKVTREGRAITLSTAEYRLLKDLALNANKPLLTPYLLHKVWGPRYSDERKYVHDYIDRLRAKIEPDPENPAFIVTVPGVGYRFATGGKGG